MRVKVIGIGAAGNKAAISAVQSNVVKIDDVLLINSTLKDIPHDYVGEKYCFHDAYGGCGKERSIAKEHMLADLKSGMLDIEKFLNVGVQGEQPTELVVLVSSTEGGTGSGSVPILAKYIRDVIEDDVNVRCFSFIGFADDTRGLRNTLEYFQEMENKFAVESVSNLKFMDDADGDKIKAEKLANAEFCKKLSILIGNPLRDSDHNIDPTDLLKIATTPKYSIVEYREFDKIKNKKEFREMVQEMIDESKAIDLNTPSQERLAVIINIDESATGAIDYSETINSTFGEPFEKFEHIQHESNLPQFMAFISSGNKIPSKEIEEIYAEYSRRSKGRDNSPDEFYDSEFELDEQDNRFNLKRNKKAVSKADFFSKMEGGKKESKSNSRSSSTTIKTDEGMEDAY